MVFFAGLVILGFMAIDTGFTQLNSWVPTGSMSTARYGHTATILLNGKVLIIGGYASSGGTQTAELYDPASGLFESVGMTLFQHGGLCTATLLLDGRVLIAGGGTAQMSAEIYNPATGSFTETGQMSYRHYGHTATRLLDGRVLIAGGSRSGDDTGGCPITQQFCEIFNPASETFAPANPLNQDRSSHTATLLDDGHILITGGGHSILEAPCTGAPWNSAELYNPDSGIFTLMPENMQYARVGHTATKLANGKVLIIGGHIYASYAELYDPESATFSPTGLVNVCRTDHTATLLLNGQILIAGGRFWEDSTELITNSAEIYDPTNGLFTLTGNMTGPRRMHSAALLPNGRVLVVGGIAIPFYALTTAELYLAPSTPEDLVEQITSEITTLPGSSEISLTIQLDTAMSKLQEARTFLKAGNLQLAKLRYCQSIGKVRDFIWNVQQKVPALISPETGQMLIAQTEALIDLIEKEMEDAGLTPC